MRHEHALQLAAALTKAELKNVLAASKIHASINETYKSHQFYFVRLKDGNIAWNVDLKGSVG